MSQEHPSVCPMDCPDTCSLLVTVENDEIVKVRGSHANPLTNGVICNKVARAYPEFIHGPNRIRHPMKRTGPRGSGRFEQISWDEALSEVASTLKSVIQAHGPEAVVPFNYAGPHGKISGSSMDARFFNKLGASQLDRGPLCAGVRGLAYSSLYGGMPGNPLEQAEHSELIVIWGNNVTVSNLHLSGIINRAQKKGAKLIVVDPKRIKIAERADLHLPITPGTDVVLAMALVAELDRQDRIDHEFAKEWVEGYEKYLDAAKAYSLEDAAEICGLDLTDIKLFAKLYGETDKAILSIANGMERSRNGGAAIRSTAVLPALTGKFKFDGGGLIMKAGNIFPDTGSKLKRDDFIPAGTRTLNIIDVATHMLEDDIDPPVRALFIYNHNPLAVHPKQNRMRAALEREEVAIIGCDIAMTDSMMYADIVLPASSHFEFDDVYGAYGQQYLQRAAPVIPRVGESLPNTEIFRRLAKVYGFDDPAFDDSDNDLMDAALDATDPRLQGFKPSELPLDRAIYIDSHGEDTRPFKNAFPTTKSGKVEIWSEDLETTYGAGLPAYQDLSSDFPLFLVTPSSDKRTNATFGGVSLSDGMERLEMHPDDARPRDLQSGSQVRVWNDQGAVDLVLSITDAVPPGTLYSPKGAWLSTSPTGQTVSALTPPSKTDIGDGACYNDARVEVSLAS